MRSIRIAALRIEKDVIVRKDAHILANFDVEIDGILIAGCALAVRHGKIMVWAPTMPSGNVIRHVRFVDLRLRDEVMAMAIAAFRGIGGIVPDTAPDGIDAALEAIDAELAANGGTLSDAAATVYERAMPAAEMGLSCGVERTLGVAA